MKKSLCILADFSLKASSILKNRTLPSEKLRPGEFLIHMGKNSEKIFVRKIKKKRTHLYSCFRKRCQNIIKKILRLTKILINKNFIFFLKIIQEISRFVDMGIYNGISLKSTKFLETQKLCSLTNLLKKFSFSR